MIICCSYFATVTVLKLTSVEFYIAPLNVHSQRFKTVPAAAACNHIIRETGLQSRTYDAHIQRENRIHFSNICNSTFCRNSIHEKYRYRITTNVTACIET